MTRKISIIIFILIAVGMGMTACDDDPKEETPGPAKDQTATITNLFGEGFSATVKGTLTNAEWDGVAGKIETALNGAFVDGIVPVKNRFKAVFGQAGGVTIIVEKATAYDNWKTTADGLTLYVNFDALDTIQSILPNAMLAMEGKYVESAQVKKQNRVRFGGGMSSFELARVSGTKSV